MSEKNLNRRDFLRLSALTAAGMALAACGAPPATEAPKAAEATATPKPAEPTATPKPAEPTATTAPPAPEGVTISYWVFWSQYKDPADKFMPALLEYVKPNKVDLRTGVNADEVFLPAVAAGTPPDIGTGHHYVDYMSKDQAVVLDDLVAASQVIKKEYFNPTNWEGSFWNGKQVAIPAIEAFVRRGLNYNARLVEVAGLDPDKPPVTWPEVMEWHKKLTKFDSAGNLLQIGLDPYDAEASVWSSDGAFPPESWGFKWWDAENRKFNIDNDLMGEAFDTLGEFVKIIGPDNLAGMRSVEGQGTWGGSFNAEMQAMIIEGYWHPGETAHEKPEVSKVNRATWVPVPEKRRGVKIQVGTGHMVFLFKGAKNPPEIVFKVGEFLQTNEHCEPVFKTIGWLPAYKPYLETVDASIFPGLDFYIKSVKEATEWWGWARCPIEGFLEKKFAEVRERHYRGEYKTGKEAAAAFQKAAEQEWKEGGYS